jgi:fermentation-respiration switch protein FrsA (DUF1100 family)
MGSPRIENTSEENHRVEAGGTPKMPAWKRRVVAYPLLLAGGYVVWCGMLFALQERLIFPRDMAGPAVHGPTHRDIESVWITAADGSRVEAWFWPGEGRSVEAPGPAVIFTHGNAELIDHCTDHVWRYVSWGVSVLLPEYRGYGRSQGKPSQDAILADMTQFYDWLAQRPEVDPSRIIFHGRSLGGGVLAVLCEKREPAALILESTFTSIASFCRRYGVPAFLCRHPFYVDRVVERLDRPMLIMHGKNDDIIPVRHGRRLRDLARHAAYVEFDAHHNDFPGDWETYWAVLRSFLDEHGLVVRAPE